MRTELVNRLMEYASYKMCPTCRDGQMTPHWVKLVCENCGYIEYIDDDR